MSADCLLCGDYHIRRSRLPEYVQALLRDDETAAMALLERDERDQ